MAQLREELKSEEAKQQRINEAIRQKQPESVKLTDRIRRNECVFVVELRDRARIRQCDAAIARLRSEQTTLETEDRALEEDLHRMNVTLEALAESVPKTQAGVAMSEAQKARYAELKEEFDRQAGFLVQANEAKRRERATVQTQIKQKREQMESQRHELENTRVGAKNKGRERIMGRRWCRNCADRSSDCRAARRTRRKWRRRWRSAASRSAPISRR